MGEHFCFMRKFGKFPHKTKTLREDRTEAEEKRLLTQPASGGESRYARFFIYYLTNGQFFLSIEDGKKLAVFV